MKPIFVKPRAGLKVYNIQTNEHHPPEGEYVANTLYIQRRIKAGELTICNPPAECADQQPAKRGKKKG